MTFQGIKKMGSRIAAIVCTFCLMTLGLPIGAWADSTTTTVDGVNYYISLTSDYAKVISYDDSSIKGALVIPSTVACNGVAYPVLYLANKLCEGDSSLTSVSLPSGLHCIPSYCFSGCTNLAAVIFPTGATCGYFSGWAFAGCTALKTVDVPVLSGAEAVDYAAWGTGSLAQPAGMGDYCFSGCTSLERVCIEAGHAQGSSAYFNDCTFSGCTSLRAVVFKAKRAMYAEALAATYTGASSDAVSYFAVDYYASEATAKADETGSLAETPCRTDSGRLGRIELEAGTNMRDIATDDEEALASKLYSSAIPDSADQKHDDGKLMDATDVYNAANNTDLAPDSCVWAFGDHSYGGYSLTLNDSCYAYPLKVNDLSGGWVASDQIAAMEDDLATYYSYSFDIGRWTSNPQVGSGSYISQYRAIFDSDDYFEYHSTGLDTDGLAVYLPDGTKMSPSDYAISYEDASGDMATSTELAAGGAFQACITPASSMYSGALYQWILVKAHVGTVTTTWASSSATSTSGSIASKATDLAKESGYSTAPYGTLVNGSDWRYALIAAGMDGLVQGQTSYCTSSTTVPYTAKADRIFVLGGTGEVSASAFDSLDTKTRIDKGDAAAEALYVYEQLRDNGADSDSVFYANAATWGDTAILCSPDSSFDVASIAAYAYQKKAPILFTDDSGEVDSATLAALKDFSNVVIAADSTHVTDGTMSALAAFLGASTNLARLDQADTDSACDVSLALAKRQLDAGGDLGMVTIVDGRDPVYAMAATNLAGYAGAPLFVTTSTADSKRIVDFLSSHADTVCSVRIFGQDDSLMSSKDWNLADEVTKIWSGDSSTTISSGDTFESDGVRFSIASASSAAVLSFYDGTRGIVEGDSVTYDGVTYTVSSLPDFSITYTGMDGATAGIDRPSLFGYDQSTHVSDPTRAGYAFRGWKVICGGVIYASGRKDLTLAAYTYPNDVTLEATWAVTSFILGSCNYKVASSGVVTLVKARIPGAKLVVAKTVAYRGKTYRIVALASRAFAGCRELRTLVVKSTYLSSKGIKGSLAGSRIAVVKVPSSRYIAYRAWFKKSNSGRTVTVKKG